jgi:DNA-binding YbaB/EbfC family protein
MARGGFSGFPGQNMQQMQQMMRQAQKLQEKMGEMTESLDAKNYEGTAGGGAVNCTVSGKHQLVSIDIKPEIIDPDDVEMLQDTIIAAVNDAMKKADEDREKTMGSLTGGLNLGF